MKVDLDHCYITGSIEAAIHSYTDPRQEHLTATMKVMVSGIGLVFALCYSMNYVVKYANNL